MHQLRTSARAVVLQLVLDGSGCAKSRPVPHIEKMAPLRLVHHGDYLRFMEVLLQHSIDGRVNKQKKTVSDWWLARRACRKKAGRGSSTAPTSDCSPLSHTTNHMHANPK